MGVPKFYRWLSERYPCLSEVVKEHQIPEFDNLYLDMNGIVHICSHPNDDDVHFRISEEKIVKDIFHYIEVLFRMIQPRKVFFMAIDGVAPRAKMNQQRGRRFRSAKEAEMSEKRAKDRGEELPKEARFDSNCITPGTSFMDRLQEQLKYFVASKMTTDTLWQGVKVILSGHETPGEGEHKIMDFIRYERSKPDYDPDTRHCLYGLDADLVMLGMCTHDPHFSLLREEVRFGGKKTPQKRTTSPEETTFHLLHLSLLREYLDHEFSGLRSTLPFKYDVESIIDDWILLGFLVGNDFLPHLPHLHINKGALSELYDIYKQELPGLGGYINVNGKLSLARFEKFLAALSMREMDRFDDIYSDNKWLEGKTAKKKRAKNNGGLTDGAGAFETIITDTPGPASVEMLLNNGNAHEIDQAGFEVGNWQTVPAAGKKKHEQQDLMRLIQSADDFLTDDVTSDTEEEDGFDTDDVGCDGAGGRDNQYHMEFRQHKREYYIRKLGYAQVTPSVLKEQAEGYVRAIQWNLHYYYNGCKSWSWYYPHHFAPWITDIKGFANMDLEFEMSTPFLPFEQLLSVLPAASKELLPKCLQGLMFQESSPIIDYYPEDFSSDLNGKQQDWEAVVLIPFIDEKRLLEAMEPFMQFLTPDEKRRNSHGPMQVFTYSLEPLGSFPSPGYFPAIDLCHARMDEVWRKEWEVPEDKLRKGLLPETRLDVFYPGFPTLKHIPHRAALKQEGVRVFEQPSRGFNMMLTLEDQGRPNIEEVAETVLGQEIWVAWPHMVEAKVVAVKDGKRTFSLAYGDKHEVVVQENEGKSKDEFFVNARGIADRYKSRWGVIVGNTQIILQACVMTGRKYVCSQHGKITLEKQWSKIAQPFALQTTRKDILVHDPSFTQYRTLPELFPIGSTCFMLGQPNYGAQGTVVDISPEQKGRITLSFTESQDVDLSELISAKDDQTLRYYPGYRCAQQLGIGSHLLSRITGTVFILRGPKEADLEHASKVNIGLNLKHNKKNEEVCGFSKRGDDNNWIYSTRTIEAINVYMTNFPEVFDYMARSGNLSNDMFHHSDVFKAGNGEARLRELVEWMNEQPFSSAARQPCGTLALDESIVAEIAKVVDKQKRESTRQIVCKIHVKPHLLFKPNLSKGGSMPDPDSNFQLFDRVVNVRQGFSVPLGLKGTITGLLQGSKPEDIIVEVLFDKEFSGGLAIRSNSNRSYRLPGSALINLSHGKGRSQQSERQPGRYVNSKPVARVKPLGTPHRNQNNQERYQNNQDRYQNNQGQQRRNQKETNKPPASEPARSFPPAPVASEDNFCHSAAPDPKMLPKPTMFFEDKNVQSRPRPPPQQGFIQTGSNMDLLWASLQQQQVQQPPSNLNLVPVEQVSQDPSDLTNQLKSMLNIGGPVHQVAPPPMQLVRGPEIYPGSYRPPFNAPSQMPGSYPRANTNYPPPPVVVPAAPGSYQQPPLAATAFVPLQVHMKHSSSRGGRGSGGGRTAPTEHAQAPASAQPAQPANRGPARRDPEQQNDRVANWVNQGQPERNAPQHHQQPQHQKGGRKKRLAANFQTE